MFWTRCIFSFFGLYSKLFNWVKPAGRQGQMLLPVRIEIRQQPPSPSFQVVEIFSFDAVKRGLPLTQLINMDECFNPGEKKGKF